MEKMGQENSELEDPWSSKGSVSIQEEGKITVTKIEEYMWLEGRLKQKRKNESWDEMGFLDEGG